MFKENSFSDTKKYLHCAYLLNILLVKIRKTAEKSLKNINLAFCKAHQIVYRILKRSLNRV